MATSAGGAVMWRIHSTKQTGATYSSKDSPQKISVEDASLFYDLVRSTSSTLLRPRALDIQLLLESPMALPYLTHLDIDLPDSSCTLLKLHLSHSLVEPLAAALAPSHLAPRADTKQMRVCRHLWIY
jgi:hypothetical protein